MSTKKLTFRRYSAVDVHGDSGFRSRNGAAFALYTNETLDAEKAIVVNAVLLDLRGSCISIGLFPAHSTDACQNNRVGSAGLPGSVACKIGNGRACFLSNGTQWSTVSCDLTTPVIVKLTVVNGIVHFFVDGSEVECPQLAENPVHGELRVGVSTDAGEQCGALVEVEGPQGIPSAEACFAPSTNGGGGRGGLGGRLEELRFLQRAQGGGDDDAPETGPLYTDIAQVKLEVERDGPVVALTPTVFRCNEAQDGSVCAAVPIGSEGTAAIGVSVCFTGIKSGYVGCGFFKKEALNSGEASQYLAGKTNHSIGCLLKNGKVFVFINDKPVFCGPTPDSDELTMHFAFDRKKGMYVCIDKGVVNCDAFKDLSLFTGDLYFAVSLSEEGQLARILPSGLGAPRFHYGMKSMGVNEDKLMTCNHSGRASLSAHERWCGDAEKVFVMRITNVCREPIGIGLVSAKLWNNGRQNTVGSNAFGPHSIGLLIKDRRIYVHHRDELVQWKPLGRMPPIPKSVDLMMRVSQGKVSFFYQGIPVVLPIVSNLTLPAEERFCAAYSMSDKGQTAVIPPNTPVVAPCGVMQRCTLLGDAAHVELTEHQRHADALFAGALCFSSEAFAITASPWDTYLQGCSACECDASSAVCASGNLWLCARCGALGEFALCDACYWSTEFASRHDHDRNQFIPLFGAGFHEMRLVVEDARDSCIEVGVTPGSYQDGLGAFAANTSVVLGKATALVQCAMPTEKLVAGCGVLQNGDEVCVRVVGAVMSVLVNGKHVFGTTLSADAPFMTLPLRFGVRLGCAEQVIRVLETSLVPNRAGDAVTVTSDADWLARECDALRVPAEERVAVGATGTLVALDALRQLVTITVGDTPLQCPLMCVDTVVLFFTSGVASVTESTGFEPAQPMWEEPHLFS